MTTKQTTIALICPGGPITKDLAKQVGEIAAAQYGDRVSLHFHPQCFFESGHFAGTEEERSAAFLEVANDPAYDTLWFARGGYGACRLDPAVFSKLNDHAREKTYLGYSDAGVILGRLYKSKIGRPAHGPMPTDATREGGESAIRRALSYLVDGAPEALEPTVKSGKKVAAFNITVLAHMVASDWAPDLTDHCVMLEDVGEYLYRVDRAMFAIMNAPTMRKAAGIMLGRISDVPENDRPFGQSDEHIVQRWCDQASVAYLGRADIGHDSANKIVPFGASATA